MNPLYVNHGFGWVRADSGAYFMPVGGATSPCAATLWIRASPGPDARFEHYPVFPELRRDPDLLG